MGGYGAMKLGLSCPEKYAVAASLSGALDIQGVLKRNAGSQHAHIFDDVADGWDKNDLFILADKLNKSNQPKPRFYIWCGTEDFLYIDNVKFRDYIKSPEFKDFNVKYEESAGDHRWLYWDLKIQTVLKYIYNP